nr:RNA-directed DNA polymerase, eukaryota [Tanacetum cinerariifolium]
MVGGNCSSFQAWEDVVGKLKARLSNLKLKTLSVGGRLTLLKLVLGSTLIYNLSISKASKRVLHAMESLRRNFFNGVQSNERKIAWVKWTTILASKKWWVTFQVGLEVYLSGQISMAPADLVHSRLRDVYKIPSSDRWVWDLNGEGVFRVKDVRYILDDVFLPKVATASGWIKYVPIKVNILAWK